MASKSVSVTNFPYWETSKRRIRYLYLVGDDSFQLTKPSTNEVKVLLFFLTKYISLCKRCVQLPALFAKEPIIQLMSLFTKEPAIPLFLGADLFLNTDVRTENHPRYHAKFAKKGLATKLAFSSGVTSLR